MNREDIADFLALEGALFLIFATPVLCVLAWLLA
jgi:hypothetical protein